MEVTKNPTPLQQDLAKWDAKQQVLLQRYGPNLFNDREFMKAKRGALDDIHKKYKNRTLNLEDKVDLAILKGQVKQMHERIYPARWQRAGLGLIKFVGRPLVSLAKLAINLGSAFLIGKPLFNESTSGRSRQSTSQVQNGSQQVPPLGPQEERAITSRHVRRDRVLTDVPRQGVAVSRN